MDHWNKLICDLDEYAEEIIDKHKGSMGSDVISHLYKVADVICKISDAHEDVREVRAYMAEHHDHDEIMLKGDKVISPKSEPATPAGVRRTINV